MSDNTEVKMGDKVTFTRKGGHYVTMYAEWVEGEFVRLDNGYWIHKDQIECVE